MKKGIFENFKDLAAEFILPAFLLLLWAAGSIGYLMAEVQGLREIPELLTLSYDEKKYSYDGPIYRLSYEAQQITPENSVIYLYNPAIYYNPNIYKEAATYFYFKTRYSLYPRKVIDAREEIDIKSIMKSDYLMFYILRDTGTAQVSAIDKVSAIERLPFLKKVFEYGEVEGYMAIYRVVK